MMQCTSDINRAKHDLDVYGVCCVQGLLQPEDINVDFDTLHTDPRVPSRSSRCEPALDAWVAERVAPTATQLRGDLETHVVALPTEARRYRGDSTGMERHTDVALYTHSPQLEAVFTVQNTDPCTRFVYYHNETRHEIIPREGEFIFVQAERTEHEVLPLCGGVRDILKIATVAPSSTRIPDTEGHACPVGF